MAFDMQKKSEGKKQTVETLPKKTNLIRLPLTLVGSVQSSPHHTLRSSPDILPTSVSVPSYVRCLPGVEKPSAPLQAPLHQIQIPIPHCRYRRSRRQIFHHLHFHPLIHRPEEASLKIAQYNPQV